jgi:hypothetical protein
MIKQIRVEVGTDKRSLLARTSRAATIGINGPNSAVWQAHSELQTAGNALVAAGVALAESQARLAALEGQIDAARNAVAAQVASYDTAYAVYVAHVETHAGKPDEVPALGLTLLAKASYALAAPLAVVPTYDVVKGQITINVQRAPGINHCVVEISPDPAGPNTWTRLPGFGGRKKLTGYAPGTYWVRAASARANAFSDFTGPVSVIVR